MTDNLTPETLAAIRARDSTAVARIGDPERDPLLRAEMDRRLLLAEVRTWMSAADTHVRMIREGEERLRAARSEAAYQRRQHDGANAVAAEALARAEQAEAERERWKACADSADEVIRAVLAVLGSGPDRDPVWKAGQVVAERDGLRSEKAAQGGYLSAARDLASTCGYTLADAMAALLPLTKMQAERDALQAERDALYTQHRLSYDRAERLESTVERVRALHRPERPSGNRVTEATPSYCGGCYEAGGYDGAPLWEDCPTLAALHPQEPQEPSQDEISPPDGPEDPEDENGAQEGEGTVWVDILPDPSARFRRLMREEEATLRLRALTGYTDAYADALEQAAIIVQAGGISDEDLRALLGARMRGKVEGP